MFLTVKLGHGRTSAMESSTPFSFAIARMHPIPHGYRIAITVVILAFCLHILRNNGWLNPFAFMHLRPVRPNIMTALPFAGHAATIWTIGFLIYLLIQTWHLFKNHFHDVSFDGHGYFFASHPWLGHIGRERIESARRIAPSPKNPMAGKVDRIEIRIATITRKGKKTTSIRLTPWFYRESADEIVANLEASGVPVAARLTKRDVPIWERDRVE